MVSSHLENRNQNSSNSISIGSKWEKSFQNKLYSAISRTMGYATNIDRRKSVLDVYEHYKIE